MTVSLPPDYHTHTYLCRHASGVPLDYIRVAEEKGLPELACTEHIYFPNDPNPTVRMTKEDYPTYLEWVKEAQAISSIPVLLGIEADYLPELVQGHVQAVLDSADFDLVLGSQHVGVFWDLAPDDPQATPDFVEAMYRDYFQKVIALAQTGLYDICAHFDLVKRRGTRVSDKVLAEIVPPALDAIAEAGMAIELNTSGMNHGVKEIYPTLQILSWMHERAIPITFGADAHAPEQAGQYFAEAVALARSAGYTQRAQFRRRKYVLVPL